MVELSFKWIPVYAALIGPWSHQLQEVKDYTSHRCFIILQLLSNLLPSVFYNGQNTQEALLSMHIFKPCLHHWMSVWKIFVFHDLWGLKNTNILLILSALLISHCHVQNMHNMKALSNCRIKRVDKTRVCFKMLHIGKCWSFQGWSTFH